MATIKGISYKALKDGIGHDRAGFQANVYYHNKKVGEVLNDGWGGPLQIHIEKYKDEVSRSIEEAFKSMNFGSAEPTLEDFFNHLYSISLDEKEFKKASKKGYECLLYLDYFPRDENGHLDFKKAGGYKPPMVYFVPKVAEAQQIIDKEKPTEYRLYTKIEDFVIA